MRHTSLAGWTCAGVVRDMPRAVVSPAAIWRSKHDCARHQCVVAQLQQHAVDYMPDECWTMGSECDGAFAEYMLAFSDESFKIESNWSNAELASIPCAYSTAENLLERSGVKEGEVVLITGASGGVGSAAIQLAKRRGASVVAISSKSKSDLVKEIGANTVVNREDKLTDCIENESWQSFSINVFTNFCVRLQ